MVLAILLSEDWIQIKMAISYSSVPWQTAAPSPRPQSFLSIPHLIHCRGQWFSLGWMNQGSSIALVDNRVWVQGVVVQP